MTFQQNNKFSLEPMIFLGMNLDHVYGTRPEPMERPQKSNCLPPPISCVVLSLLH